MRGTWFHILGMFGLAFVGAGIAVAQGDPPAKDEPGAESVEKAASKADKLRETLDKRLDWNLEAVPLETVVRKLREQTGLTIVVPPKSLESAGLEADQPFSLKAKNMSLRAGLNHLLRDLDLAWGFDVGKLVIASSEEAAALMTTETYSLTELLSKGTGREKKANLERIIDTALQSISPDSWEDAGGNGTISAKGSRLVARQTLRVHEQLERLFSHMKEAKEIFHAKDPEVTSIASWRIDEPEGKELKRCLSKPAAWPFEEGSVGELVAFLEAKHGVTVLVDDESLAMAEMTRDQVLSAKIKGLTLGQGLTRLLRTRGLCWFVKDESIFITTRDRESDDNLAIETRLYYLADLSDRKRKGDRIELDSLIEIIMSHFAPTTWPDGTGPILESTLFGALIIPQTREVHEQIAEFFATLRRLRRDDIAIDAPTIAPIEIGDERDAGLRAALDKEASFDFREVTLAAAAKAIAAKYTIPVLLDERTLEDYGIDKDEPLGEQALMMPLAKALDMLLGPLDLYWCVRDGALVVTAEEQTRTRFYPVHDLVKAGDKAAADALAEAGDKLKADVESNAEPDSWGDAGGSGAASFFPRPAMLIVTQTETGHREVEAFLKKRRSAKE